MDLDLPNNLHPTRDLLMRSLVMHTEQAPAMPTGLAADLAARFAARESVTPLAAPVSWFEKVRGFFSTPAFGAVAAAVVLLGVAVPMMSGPTDRGSEHFRGSSAALGSDTIRILFIGQNPKVVSLIQASGDFEASAISSVGSQAASRSVTGPAVIVDFTGGSLSLVDRDGTVMHREDLSGDAAAVVASIASALTRF